MGLFDEIKKPFKKLFRSFKKGSKAIARAFGFGALFDQRPPSIDIPAAPTLDEARRSTDELDRIRRRRGVLSNIFGGAVGGTPTVGTTTLLGGGQ
jgi:hypothetical protein